MKVINFRDGTDPLKGPPGYSHSVMFSMTLSTGKEGPRAWMWVPGGWGFEPWLVMEESPFGSLEFLHLLDGGVSRPSVKMYLQGTR